jgi:hypothetical protein
VDDDHGNGRATLTSSLLRELAFSRASARTNSDTGAEIASGIAFAPTVAEIVPTGVSEVADSDGYGYVGRFSDGRYVFNGPSGIYTSTNGEPPYTLLVASTTANRITLNDTLLRLPQTEPGTIYRRPTPYTSETLVHTMQRGYAIGNGPSGTNTGAATSMTYGESPGGTILISEYTNTEAIKGSANPPRYIHRSINDGVSWTMIDPIPGADPYTHTHVVFYDNPTGNWYYTCGDPPSTNPGIYKSTDDGLNWTRIINNGTQPVSALRFGNYIVWGTDNIPTGIDVHDPLTDTCVRAPSDYYDPATSIYWNGVVYNLAIVNGLLLLFTAQASVNYHCIYATDDLQRFWKVLDMNTAARAFTQPVVRDDGSFLVKASETGSGNFIRVSGLTLKAQSAIATDEAADSLTETTIPLDGGAFWTVPTGAYIGTTGPGGMRAYKIGEIARTGAGTSIPASANTLYEMSAWVRNSLTLGSGTYLTFWRECYTSGGAYIGTYQDSILGDQVSDQRWERVTRQFTTPASTGNIQFKLTAGGFTYDASTAYFEVAGLTVTPTADADIETNNRAAESATVDKAVGAAWGVYDRIYPRWDTSVLAANKTLLTLTDVDTSAYLSVIYNATSKAFTITDGSTTEVGTVVRCLGDHTHTRLSPSAVIRRHFGERDFLAYGVRRAGGTTQLIVWDKDDRVIAAVTAPGSFAPSNLRITFPASSVLHVPSFASDELTDAQTFSALQGIEDILPGPPSELRVIPGGWSVIVPDIVRVW